MTAAPLNIFTGKNNNKEVFYAGFQSWMSLEMPLFGAEKRQIDRFQLI